MTLTVREYDGDVRHPRGSPTPRAVGSFCRAEYIIDASSSGPGPLYPQRASVGPLRRTSSLSQATAMQLCHHYLVSAPRRVFVDLFLPVGYPHSVGESYLRYQVFDSVQGICSYLRGVVSTSAVLSAAGVGDAEATAMSAAAAWAMRDGLGMVGGLIFSYCASARFDSHVKEYRLFADVINDVGLTLDMVAPYFGRGRVIYVTGVATVCKVMCGMAAGATKGSITHHFAVRGNMADLNAKESTQETLMSLLGMIMGIILARYLHRLERLECNGSSNVVGDGTACKPGNVAAVMSWTIFVALTALHVWTNYLGVKLLRLRTLNRERAEVVLRGVINGCTDYCQQSLVRYGTLNEHHPLNVGRLLDTIDTIPTPNEVNESLWASTRKLLFPGKVHLGTRLSETFYDMSNEDMLHYLKNVFRNEHYVLSIVSTGGIWQSSSWRVLVTLRSGAREQDEMKAFLHAMVISRCMDGNWAQEKKDGPRASTAWRRKLIFITHSCVSELLGEQVADSDANGDGKGSVCKLSLDALSDRGWDCERLYLGFGPCRIQWEAKHD